MKRVRVLLLLGALAWIPAVLRAQAPTTDHAAEMAPAQALAHRVKDLQRAILSEKPEAVNVAVQQVEAMRLRYSILDLMPLVEGMTLWAREQGFEGQPETGLQALAAIERWAPLHPTILGARVDLMRQQGIAGWFRSFPDLLRLTRLRLQHSANRWLWLMQHAASLRLTATLLIWGWALALGLRYRNVLRNLWEEAPRERRVSPHLCAAGGAFILALPLLLGLDPTYMAYWWLWLLAPFLHSGEVKITAFVVILQILHPALALMEPLARVPPPPSVVTLQIQPQARAVDVQELKALPESDRRFIQGWRQLQQGDWPGAEATFESLLAAHPDKGQVLNNLGVARFQRGDRARAEQDFLQAGQAAPGRVEILLNQSVIHFTKLETEQGAQKQEEARAADPILYSKLVAISGDQKEPRTFAMPLPDDFTRVKALEAGEVAEKQPSPFQRPSFLITVIAPIAVLGVIIGRIRAGVRKSHGTQCIRCGEPFHTTDSNDPEVCSKCHHLFVLKDGLHQESRRRKAQEAAAYQASTRRFHKALIFLLPGCDLIFLGNAGRGLTEWFLVCVGAGMVLATGRTVRYPGEVLADPVSTWLPAGMAFLALLYLRSWFKLIPRGHSGA